MSIVRSPTRPRFWSPIGRRPRNSGRQLVAESFSTSPKTRNGAPEKAPFLVAVRKGGVEPPRGLTHRILNIVAPRR